MRAPTQNSPRIASPGGVSLTSFKNKHQGKRAFIVGTGPSLKNTNLDLIAKEISFGVHRVADIFSETIWRPTFQFCITTSVKRPAYRKAILRGIREAEYSFLGQRIYKWMGDQRKAIYIQAMYIGEARKDYAPGYFHTDIDNGKVSVYGMSSFGCIQLADYMGCNPIYLVGMDLGYKPHRVGEPDISHYSAEYGREMKTTRRTMGMIDGEHRRAYAIIRVEAPHLQIINCTVGGALELFPRQSLKEAIQ